MSITAELPANFSVWMASQEAAFTHGKFLFANWDVDELKSKASQIKDSADLLIGMHGVAPIGGI